MVGPEGMGIALTLAAAGLAGHVGPESPGASVPGSLQGKGSYHIVGKHPPGFRDSLSEMTRPTSSQEFLGALTGRTRRPAYIPPRDATSLAMSGAQGLVGTRSHAPRNRIE